MNRIGVDVGGTFTDLVVEATDATTLLHASGHVMSVYREPLREARDRIRARSFGEITAIKRLELCSPDIRDDDLVR